MDLTIRNYSTPLQNCALRQTTQFISFWCISIWWFDFYFEIVVTLSSDLASHFDLFGFECFFFYIWIFDILYFSSNASDERLLLEMYIWHTKILHMYSTFIVYFRTLRMPAEDKSRKSAVVHIWINILRKYRKGVGYCHLLHACPLFFI